MQEHPIMLTRNGSLRRSQRGMGLLDALVALGILAFGLLAMTRFQTKMVAQASESQMRLVAAQFADELMSLALVDGANLTCYTLPNAGGCGNANAKARAEDWQARVTASLPSATASSAVAAAGVQQRFTVSIGWAARDKDDPKRKLEATTDVQ